MGNRARRIVKGDDAWHGASKLVGHTDVSELNVWNGMDVAIGYVPPIGLR